MADSGESGGTNEGGGETTGSTESTSAEMPAGVPSKFWNTEAGSVNFEAWGKATGEMGGSQEMFEAGVGQFIEAQMSAMPNLDAEMEALGEYASSRVERVQMWAQQNLGEDMMPAMADMMSSAKNIEVVEALMEKMGEAPFSSQEMTAFGKGDSYAELREMQNDPKYWDPLNRDAAHVKKVEDGYRLLEEQERAHYNRNG